MAEDIYSAIYVARNDTSPGTIAAVASIVSEVWSKEENYVIDSAIDMAQHIKNKVLEKRAQAFYCTLLKTISQSINKLRAQAHIQEGCSSPEMYPTIVKFQELLSQLIFRDDVEGFEMISLCALEIIIESSPFADIAEWSDKTSDQQLNLATLFSTLARLRFSHLRH